jgi:hypothetical protein
MKEGVYRFFAYSIASILLFLLASATGIEARGADVTQILQKYETLRPFSRSKSHIFAIIRRTQQRYQRIKLNSTLLAV